MKKIFLTLMISLGLLLPGLAVASSGTAGAVNLFEKTCDASAAGTDVCKDVRAQAGSTENPIIRTLRIALTIISYVAGIIAIIMLIIAGLRFITANGDANGVQSARNTVLYSLIGIVVIATSQAIITFVLKRL